MGHNELACKWLVKLDYGMEITDTFRYELTQKVKLRPFIVLFFNFELIFEKMHSYVICVGTSFCSSCHNHTNKLFLV